MRFFSWVCSILNFLSIHSFESYLTAVGLCAGMNCRQIFLMINS